MVRSALVRHVSPAAQTAIAGRTRTSWARPRPFLPTPTGSILRTASSLPHNATFARRRRLPWVLSSITAAIVGFYTTALVIQARRPCQDPNASDLSKQKDVSARYDETADSFDSEVGVSETLMGITRMRKRLAGLCTGHVLEVSCGTGRNLGYYDISKQSSIESLTFVDLSQQMVDVCKKKWEILFGDAVKDHGSNIKPTFVSRFLTASALDAMPPPPSKQKYDTIIQTMGLCSTPSPIELVANMIRHLDTSNPEARILLLEHGRSHRDWLNNILDNAAEKHAEIHGCWFNRDIGALVREGARQSGLQLASEKRHHFGTTWIFELRPSPELVARSRPSQANESGREKEQKQPLAAGWRSWLGFGG